MRPSRDSNPPVAGQRMRRTGPGGFRRVMVLAVGLGLAWTVWTLAAQYARTYALERQAVQLDQQRRDLVASNQALRDEIQRLKTDSGYLEWLARKDFGMVRPGEIEFLIVRRHAAGSGRDGEDGISAPGEWFGPGAGGGSAPPPGGSRPPRGPAGWFNNLVVRLSSLVGRLRSGR